MHLHTNTRARQRANVPYLTYKACARSAGLNGTSTLGTLLRVGSVGMLACWRFGTLVLHLVAGALARWHFGAPLTCWHQDTYLLSSTPIYVD